MSVRVERSGPVATVVLDRPEVKNAVDFATAMALYETFLALDQDDSVGAMVLWGAGGTFCSGADLRGVAGETPNPLVEGGVGSVGPMGPTRLLLSKPVVAAIEGFAVAGGLELALWCDVRVCSEQAIFGVYCRKWGVPLIDGGTIRLPAVVGMGRAQELILSGRSVGASEALSIGLANRVVGVGQSRQEAEAWAASWLAFPQGALRADRISAYFAQNLELALREEFARGVKVLAESQKGASKFLYSSKAHRK